MLVVGSQILVIYMQEIYTLRIYILLVLEAQ